MKTNTKIVLAVVVLLIVIVPVGITVRNNGSSSATKDIDVLADAYPLYSAHIVWGSRLQLSVPPHTATNPTDSTVTGYEVSSMQTATTTNIASIAEPFRNYYDQKLLGLGWTIDPTFQADGAGSSVWGFRKGADVLIFSYNSTFLHNQPNTPVQCPCTIEFSILGGTKK